MNKIELFESKKRLLDKMKREKKDLETKRREYIASTCEDDTTVLHRLLRSPTYEEYPIKPKSPWDTSITLLETRI